MRRGLALLLAVGTIAILGILGVAFVGLVQLERRSSLQGVHATRALLLARSGRILRAEWTAHLPQAPHLDLRRDSLSGLVEAVGVPRIEDPVLADDPVTKTPRVGVDLELVDAAAGLTGPPLVRLVNGGRLDRAMMGFRYRARFWTALEHPLDDPVLESPVLEDVTFAWQDAGGVRVLGWGR